MNERDSEEVLGMLTAQGYEIAEREEEADVILLNTCSVRAHAEERAFGKMGELSELKKERPEVVLGIIGCMAKLHQETIFKRLPKVDLIAGPAELYDLPYLLAEIQEKRQLSDKRHATSDKVMAVSRVFRPLNAKPNGDYRKPGVTAFVTIMEGCDKACTYCIVPKTRGQEISRPAEEIIAEIKALVQAGYKEVTLLGQNVNSYGKRFPDGSGYKGPLGRLRLIQAAHAGEPLGIPSAAEIGEAERGRADPSSLLDFPQLLRLIDQEVVAGAPAPARSGARSGRSVTKAGTMPRSRHGRRRECRPPEVVGLRRAGHRAVPGTSLAHPACGWVPGLGRRPPNSSPVGLVGQGGRGLNTALRASLSSRFARRALGRPGVRIRFTTSHPFDANERLFEAMRDCDSVCEYLHLPVQSGSNRILRAMRRGYTAESYLKKIERLRQLVPDISLSTDIIVGFPGETQEDFEATARLMREVGYDYAYIFKYSPRPGTDAAAKEDDVPQPIKDERNKILLALQEQLSHAKHRSMEGREVEILVEEKGRFERQWFGRTRGHHGVIVESPEELIGRTVQARITRGTEHTLFGEVACSA